MKVLVISAAFPPMRAGEADHAFHLCRQLADRNLDVQVLTTKNDDVAIDPRFKVHPIMGNWSWSELPRFSKFLGHCSPDAVLLMYIGFMYNDHPMITFASTLLRGLLPRGSFVTLFTNPMAVRREPWPIHTRCFRKGLKIWAGGEDVDYEFGTLLRDSDRLIVLCESHREKLLKRFHGVDEKTLVIPPPPLMHICPEDNGVSREKGRKLLGVESEEFLVSYIGYIYPPKGIETLVQAVHIVSSQRRNVRLILVGGILDDEYPERPRYAQEVFELVKDLGIDGKSIWTGGYDWDSDQASLFLRAADVCVLPLDYGVSLNNSSLAAAAAHGLPLVVTRGRNLEEAFIHGENVLVCRPKSPEEIAAAIIALMDQPDLKNRLRSGALELAQEFFSWDRATEKMIATLFSHRRDAHQFHIHT